MVVTNYKSCMNQKNTNNSSLADIQAMATEVTELFPVDDADYGTNKTMTEKDQEGLAKAIAYLSKRGIPVFGEFWTTPDNQNPVKSPIPHLPHCSKSNRMLWYPNLARKNHTINLIVHCRRRFQSQI